MRTVPDFISSLDQALVCFHSKPRCREEQLNLNCRFCLFCVAALVVMVVVVVVVVVGGGGGGGGSGCVVDGRGLVHRFL